MIDENPMILVQQTEVIHDQPQEILAQPEVADLEQPEELRHACEHFFAENGQEITQDQGEDNMAAAWLLFYYQNLALCGTSTLREQKKKQKSSGDEPDPKNR